MLRRLKCCQNIYLLFIKCLIIDVWILVNVLINPNDYTGEHIFTQIRARTFELRL